MRMGPREREAIRRNLFPEAQAAIRDWNAFPWHRDSRKAVTAGFAQSSQALAIDFFGTVGQLDCRDRIFHAWGNTWGVTTDGPWSVKLGQSVPAALLGEPRSTQVDVVASDAARLIFFECKFTEGDGGSCSQTRPLVCGPHRGKSQCNGNYELQRNPLNGLSSRCALTAKGVKYWEWIPRVFSIDSEIDHRGCPFAGTWYQWMRNLVVCAALAEKRRQKGIFVVVYAGGADAAGFPMARRVAGEDWRTLRGMLHNGPVSLEAVSYERLLQFALEVAAGPDAEVLMRLGAWLERKMRLATTYLGGPTLSRR